VLVHHADPEGDRVLRRTDGSVPAPDEDGPVVRTNQSVEDVHECGLPRSVLAEEGVYLAFAEVEVNLHVGHDVSEVLRDASHGHDEPVVARIGAEGFDLLVRHWNQAPPLTRMLCPVTKSESGPDR
jgi:hypothetical protein